MKYKIVFCILGVTVFLFSNAFAEWSVYDCSVLPVEDVAHDSTWYEQGDNDDNVSDMLTVIDDPDITGNKLIQVVDADGAPKEQWAFNWNADPDNGATLMFRAKALEAGTYDRDFDLYLYNGVVRERLVSNRGTAIQFNKAGQSANVATDEWRVYRVTIQGDLIECYVDEDPLSYLSVTGEISEGNNLFRFGDLGSSTMGSLFDWFIWDPTGAYPPGIGPDFPPGLADISSTPVLDNDAVKASSVALMQNYPNPFNPDTEIRYTVSGNEKVSVKVFNTNGKLVQTLVNESQSKGSYAVSWNGLSDMGNAVPSGIYFCHLNAGKEVRTIKMTLMK